MMYFSQRNHVSKMISVLLLLLYVGGARSAYLPESLDSSEQNDLSSIFDKNIIAENLDSLHRQTRESTPEFQAIKLTRQAFSLLQSNAVEESVAALHRALEINPRLEYANILLALAYLENQQFHKALDAAGNMQKNMPDNPSGLNLAGYAYYYLKDKEKSKQSFLQAQKLKPGDTVSSENLAAFALMAGDVEQARTLYKQALAYNPGHPGILFHLSRIEYEAGNLKLTESYLNQAVENKPDDLQSRVALAKLYIRQNKANRALAVSEPALQDFPAHSELLEVVGIARMESGDYEDAIKHLTSALKQAKPGAKIRVLYFLAVSHEQAGQNDLAEIQIDSALNLAPELVEALLVKARIKAKKGDLNAAQTILTTLEQKYPKSASVLELKGSIALAKKQSQDAIALFQAALKYRKSNVTTIKLAMAFSQAGDQESAYVTLKNWLKAFPEDIRTRTAMADLALFRGDYRESRQQYGEIIALQPDNVNSHNNLAWVLAQEGDFDEALSHARTAYKLAADNTDVIDTLAVVLFKHGQKSESTQILLSAMLSLEQQPEKQLRLIRTFTKVEAKREAEQQLDKLLSRYPELNGVREVEDLYRLL